MNKEAIDLLESLNIRERADDIWAFQKEGNLSFDQREAIKKYSCLLHDAANIVSQALTILKQQPTALDFAINCGAMGKGDDSCCGCIYWSVDGKLLCNECGTEYYLVERQPAAGEQTKRVRTILANVLHDGRPTGYTLDAEEIYEIKGVCDRLDTSESINVDLVEALEEIRDLETECCSRCEGNGRLYVDGKGHLLSENAETILCGNCGGSGRILPENAQEIAEAALAKLQTKMLTDIKN